jgi:outer membrane immunogenic protein
MVKSSLLSRAAWLAAAAFFAGPALAADFSQVAPLPPVAMATVPSWTGIYAGVQAGRAVMQDSERFSVSSPAESPLFELGDGDWALGGFAGAQAQIGERLVVGFEGNAVYRDLALYYADDYSILTSSWTAGVRGRVGVLVTPNALLYATLGWQWAGFESPGRESDGNPPFVDGGLEIGGGIETLLSNRLLLRADLAYVDYGTHIFADEGTPITSNGDIAELIAQIGIGYHFGDSRPAAPVAFAVAPSDWTGPYAGLQAGYGMFNTWEVYNPAYLPAGDPDRTAGGRGPAGGAFAGFDLAVGDRFVAGFEASGTLRQIVELFAGEDQLTSKWAAGIGGRAGVLVTPTTLFYGSLGWQWAGFRYAAFAGYPGGEGEWTANGPRVGMGIESLIGANLFVRADLGYAWYPERTFYLSDHTPALETEIYELTGMLGVGVHL